MRQFLEAVRASLEARNWLAALSTTMTIPDMAGWASFPAESAGHRYRRWFDENLAATYVLPLPAGSQAFLTASDCWALRCSFLHSGQDEIAKERAQRILSRFIFSVTGSHLILFGDVLQLDVRLFCKEFLAASELWLQSVDQDEAIQERLRGMLYVRTEEFSPVPGFTVR